MESKTFELCNRSYRLFQDWTLEVFTVSIDDWAPVNPKKVVVRWVEYYRYALYNPKHDWTDDNEESLIRYENKMSEFRTRRESVDMQWPVGWIVTNRLKDIVAPAVPQLGKKWEWKRFYRSHGSIVLQYWYGADIDWKQISFVNNVKGNKFHVDNWIAQRTDYSMLKWGRKKISEWLVNTMLANAGSYSTEYIGKALGVSWRFVAKVLLWSRWYDKVWDRQKYMSNIRASRGSFYNITCYPWEIEYDFINRVMVMWDNQVLYEKYCHCDSNGTRNNKGRMGYALWEEKYWRDMRVSKALMKRWVELNAECIDNVEELNEYIDGWSLGSSRCWDIDKYNKYMEANKYRMPKKVKVMENVPCVLRTVGIQSEEKTLFSLSDFVLLNCFDKCMWDFYSITDWKWFIATIEDEPDWNMFEENWYESREWFFASYESMLWGWTIGDFRKSYEDLLRSIPI